MLLWLSDNLLRQTETQRGSEEINLIFYAAGCTPGSTRKLPGFLQRFYAAESKSIASKPAFCFICRIGRCLSGYLGVIDGSGEWSRNLMLKNPCATAPNKQNLWWSVLVLLCSGHRGDKWSHSVCVLALIVPGCVVPTGAPSFCGSVTQRTCPCHFLWGGEVWRPC